MDRSSTSCPEKARDPFLSSMKIMATSTPHAGSTEKRSPSTSCGPLQSTNERDTNWSLRRSSSSNCTILTTMNQRSAKRSTPAVSRKDRTQVNVYLQTMHSLQTMPFQYSRLHFQLELAFYTLNFMSLNFTFHQFYPISICKYSVLQHQMQNI